MPPEPASSLQLADYRSAVARLYAAVLAADDHAEAWKAWCRRRDELLTGHPQGPLAGSDAGAPPYHPYDPTWRVAGRVRGPVSGAPLVAEQPDGSVERFDPLGSVEFEWLGQRHVLPLYWTHGYSGGLFLPFGDATNGDTTYGSGRYLLDQAKSAFLGFEGGDLVLDFNFAYHPSCVWGEWVCPLPRPESRLPIRVEAGERTFDR